MTENKINGFLAVVHYGSFSRAAEALYMSQPSLTFQIQSLEQELETKLLIRQAGIHGIALTSAGQNFLPIAEQWKKLYYQSQHLLAPDHAMEYRMSVIQSLNTGIMPAICHKFLLGNPNCMLTVDVHYSVDAYRAMESQQSHCALITIPCSAPKVISTPLFREKMYVLCSAHKEIGEEPHASQLRVEHEIFLKWGNEFETWHSYWFGDKRPAMIVSDLPTPEALIADSEYWAIIPASIANRIPPGSGVQCYSLTDGPKDRIVYFLSHRAESRKEIRQINEQFLTVVHETVKTQKGISFIHSPPYHIDRRSARRPSSWQGETDYAADGSG